MDNFNKSAVGDIIRVNMHEDISAATVFSMKLEPEQGCTVTVTPTLGTSDVTENNELFEANKYVEFPLTANIFKYVGRWKKKATATISDTNVVSSNQSLFRVTE